MTAHSLQRTKERASLNTAAAIRLIEKANCYGKQACDFPANEREYLRNIGIRGSIAKYYAGYCFIYGANGRCITMYKVPTWFGKHTHYNGKTRIRNPKKYDKFNRIADLMEYNY